jgi:hypothetical protein
VAILSANKTLARQMMQEAEQEIPAVLMEGRARIEGDIIERAA